jgi:putative mRNA 3-end processing factor
MYSNPRTRATQETIDLFLCQKKPTGPIDFQPTSFNEEIVFDPDIPNLDVKLVSSGHVLGSASVSVNYNDKVILFTSDIGGRGQLTIKEPVTKIDADILVIEATFGSPELVFPSREEISMEILKWSADVIKEKRNVVFSAGKLGSAQELIKMFNNLTNLRVITHGEVTPVSEVYQKHGIPLEYFDSKSEEGREILRDGEAIVIQPRDKKIVPYFIKEHVNYRSAIVTGMASRFIYKDFDAAFPLSSHANYHELIEYIQEVSPELIFTMYGLEEKLAKAITNELGIPAIPLRKKDEQTKHDIPKMPIAQSKKKTERELPKPAIEKKSLEDDAKKKTTLDDYFN